MEAWSTILCGILIATGVFSSQAVGKDLRKISLSGLAVNLSASSSAVLSGNVNLSFHFPGNFTDFSPSRTLSVLVYDNSTGKRLHTESVLLDGRDIFVSLPCEIFDHPGLYRFKYRISNSEIEAFISQTLSFYWGDILLSSPTNHTALTRFGSTWIRHYRKCLPKTYRDEVNLYYMKGQQKIFVTRSYVRKLTKGRQKSGGGSWIRMVFPCEMFSAEGTYRLEYQTGFANLTLATSEDVHVYWGHRTLHSPARNIFPCTNAIAITFTPPECPGTNDGIEAYEKYTDKIVARKPAELGHTTVFFTCSLFRDYVKEYCFRYVTDSSLTGGKVTASSVCLASHPPGTSTHDGWSSWSSWGLCSSSCGQGKQHRYRFCLSVSTAQEKSGACTGRALMSRPCALSPCPATACSCGCRLTAQHGMITSSPQLFARLGPSSCTWIITLKGGGKVRLWFDALRMNGDSIIIRDGNDSSAPKIVTIKDDKFKEVILSTGSSMYIFYWHNGRWTNGTRRGFTASYRKDEEAIEVLPVKPKTLGKEEVTFLGVFIFAVLTIAVLLFIVFTKLRRQHKLALPPSSGSSSTSESTLRSTGTSSPLDDVASSSEPLRGCHSNRTTKSDRHRTRRKKPRRTEFLCDTDVPRCTCGEVSEMESGSGSNSVSECSPVRGANNSIDRVLMRASVECDCPECLRLDTHPVNSYRKFRVPEKKYYGDWMLTEMPVETSHQEDQRIYRHSCTAFV